VTLAEDWVGSVCQTASFFLSVLESLHVLRPCFAGYFPVAVYIKFSYGVICLGGPLRRLVNSLRSKTTRIIGRRRPFVCLYLIVFGGFRRHSVLGVDTKDGILECGAV